jgi:hypothetical protein
MSLDAKEEVLDYEFQLVSQRDKWRIYKDATRGGDTLYFPC